MKMMERCPQEDSGGPVALTGGSLDRKLVSHSGEHLALTLCKMRG